MDIHNYVDEKKKLYEKLLIFINNDTYDQEDFSQLMEIIDQQNIPNHREDLHLLLLLIDQVSKNHHRNSEFFNKIEAILSEINESIKQTFTNIEIFNIFKSNKRILLFLLKSNIITVDLAIYNEIKAISKKYEYYFYPEIKNFYSETERKSIENELTQILGEINMNEFEENRKIGENESFICKLIRQDSVEEFIAYLNRIIISPNSTIKPSIFETNPFLEKHEPTLIEYASFFGSIQIIRYLLFNKVQLGELLWIYSIYSNNTELIHFLQENEIPPPIFDSFIYKLPTFDNYVKPPNIRYLKCYKNALKCHHNEIAQYIYDYLIDEKSKIQSPKDSFFDNIISYCFHYYNFSFFPSKLIDNFIFLYLCQYNYLNLVRIYLNNTEIDINYTIILKIDLLIKIIVLRFLHCYLPQKEIIKKC